MNSVPFEKMMAIGNYLINLSITAMFGVLHN